MKESNKQIFPLIYLERGRNMPKKEYITPELQELGDLQRFTKSSWISSDTLDANFRAMMNGEEIEDPNEIWGS